MKFIAERKKENIEALGQKNNLNYPSGPIHRRGLHTFVYYIIKKHLLQFYRADQRASEKVKYIQKHRKK